MTHGPHHRISKQIVHTYRRNVRDFSFLKDHLARKDLNCHHEMRLLKSVLNDMYHNSHTGHGWREGLLIRKKCSLETFQAKYLITTKQVL